MSDIILRNIKRDSCSSVLKLILEEDHKHLEKTIGFIPTFENVCAQTFEDPDYNIDLLIGAFCDGILIGCVMGCYRPWKNSQNEIGMIKFIIVKLNWRRKGVGKKLLNACEKSLKKHPIKSLAFGNSSPRYIMPGVPELYSDIGFLLKSEGWIASSERISFFVCLADTSFSQEDFDTTQKKHADFEVSLATTEDREAVFEFINKEFKESWAFETDDSFNNKNGYCSILKTKKKQTIVGFSVINSSNPNWFGPMGIRSDLRKQGLGHILFGHSLQMASKSGMDHLIINWINGKETFYKKFFNKIGLVRFFKFEKCL